MTGVTRPAAARRSTRAKLAFKDTLHHRGIGRKLFGLSAGRSLISAILLLIKYAVDRGRDATQHAIRGSAR